jgi:hypothetical protein
MCFVACRLSLLEWKDEAALCGLESPQIPSKCGVLPTS